VRGAVGAGPGNVERLEERGSVQTEQGYNQVERTKKVLQLAAETVKLRTEGQRIAQNQLAQRASWCRPADRLPRPATKRNWRTCLRGRNWNKQSGALQALINCATFLDYRPLIERRRPVRLRVLALLCASAVIGFAQPSTPALSPTNIFAPVSTPADAILDLSRFVLEVTGAIFVVVFSLLAYAVVKFRKRSETDGREPAQVYGSSQLELAWTVIPVLIVVVLFLTAARVIASIQNAEQPSNALEVTVIGHQFWWEYRYPSLKVVTANELHIPVSDPAHPTPTFLTLLSADTDHSFWVPRLAGKTDLIPNHPNRTWVDPHETGLFLGQCAQYCGTQHALMLLRVYVDSREDFDRWIEQQRKPAQTSATVSEGQRIFETTACVNCHTIAGTAANGTFGPDLTHLMSRQTIASGVEKNNIGSLIAWIYNPAVAKPGCKMPSMGLSLQQSAAVAGYLATLR
jgi:cytochrome c oxidase subunit II